MLFIQQRFIECQLYAVRMAGCRGGNQQCFFWQEIRNTDFLGTPHELTRVRQLRVRKSVGGNEPGFTTGTAVS